jgi:hypothetical protein
MVRHHAESICDFGLCDNSETEQSEAAHAGMIKEAYRSTNKVKPMLQMLRWEVRLFKFKGRTALLQYLVKTSSRWATVCVGSVDELPIDRKEGKTVISGHIP